MTIIQSAVLAGLALAVALATLSPAEAARAKKHAPPPPAETPAPKAQGPAAAQPLGTSESWSAYQATDGTGQVCYLVGKAQKREPAGFARKPPMAMVTHRPAEKIANVVSFVEGYPIKEGSEVAIEIGSSKFELFTKDDGAWARTAELDRAIVTALGKAKRVVVRGVPQKGPATTDVYALAGFAKTLALIDKACGVKR
ncbi:MAG TPA: invasion associated locus B family protein [Stellaceae bacterium]|nr:invasion associated locus B family protein [Stellaceae bacterium]